MIKTIVELFLSAGYTSLLSGVFTVMVKPWSYSASSNFSPLTDTEQNDGNSLCVNRFALSLAGYTFRLKCEGFCLNFLNTDGLHLRIRKDL